MLVVVKKLKDFEFIIPPMLSRKAFLRGKLINLASLILFILLLPHTEILCEPQKAPSSGIQTDSDWYPFSWKLNIKWKDVPLAEIPIPYPKIKVMEGYGNVSLTLDNFKLPSKISYSAEGNIDKCKIYLSKWNEEIHQIKANFVIKDKKLEVSSLEGQFKDIPFTAQANVNLTSPYPFDAKVKAEDIIIEEITSFFPLLKSYSMIKTPAEAEFNINGVLPSGPLEGTITLQEASFYSLLMNNVEISFVWRDNKVIVRNISANLSEGTISGEGEIILNTK